MNAVLQLKGRFNQRTNPNKPGKPQLPKNAIVTLDHIQCLKRQLENILKEWELHTEINGAIVSVHYHNVVAKSNRLGRLLSFTGNKPTDSICGAKFEYDNLHGKRIQKHVFTHYVPLEAIRNSIYELEIVIDIIKKEYNKKVTYEQSQKINSSEFKDRNKMSANIFILILRDCWYVERFDIDRVTEKVEEDQLITLYKTGINIKDLLIKFGIQIVDDRIFDDTTVRLYPEEVNRLIEKAGYLISMSVTNVNELTRDDVIMHNSSKENEITSDELIPLPGNEPIVGVIDTEFNESVYFHKWVDVRNLVDESIPKKPEDMRHGTAVTSIIVDGPKGNPQLDDGCGRFRVRHFGVATSKVNSFWLLRQIRSIVSENRDIKVWNLSLGSVLEIKENSISPEGAELDKIQNEFDVIFIVAGTNKNDCTNKNTMKIGAPADSLNSLVVNSVNFSNESASYTRIGPVLSFFYKPDISYYGGDGNYPHEKIAVCIDSKGATYMQGTSFAAPWITRKMAYLINIMGLSKEVAKALIIDAAAGWNSKDDLSYSIGYGVVPKHINDILYTPDDEIRFILSGTVESYETYALNLPVPIVKDAHPYYARATLAYFPKCDRNQGVDYTNTEMDIHFGRIQIKNGKTTIKSIDNNKQSEVGLQVIYEEDARRQYRKWDNVKHICEEIKSTSRARKAYESGLWGLSIKTKDRLTTNKKEKLAFGVVVTLKEMNGVNRIEDFIKACWARQWIVNRLDIQNQMDIYARAEEQVQFDE